MSDLVSTFRSYALDKDNCPRMDTEVVYVRVGLLKEAADRIAQLEAALRIAQRGLDPYASYEAQLDARVVVDGICAALGEERT